MISFVNRIYVARYLTEENKTNSIYENCLKATFMIKLLCCLYKILITVLNTTPRKLVGCNSWNWIPVVLNMKIITQRIILY